MPTELSTAACYRPIIVTASVAAGAAGVPGAFSAGLDITAVSGLWAGMTVAIARESGHEVDRAFAAKLVATVTSSVAGYMGGSKVLTTFLHLVPGGTIVAVGANSTLNFLYTWRLGHALAEMFDRPNFSADDLCAVGSRLARLMVPAPTAGEIVEIVRALRGSNQLAEASHA